MNTAIHTYKEAYTYKVTVYSDGSCRKDYLAMYHIREVINKMACVNIDSGENLISALYMETSDASFAPGSTLYAASECKTGRDTFRNSGYSITRSPEKADAIVVPDVRADYYHSYPCNMIGYDEENENLYLINIEKPGYLISQLTEEDMIAVKKFLAQKNIEVEDIQRSQITVWFIPKCNELRDVMQGKKLPNVPYIQESKVPIKASTTFSAETLVFWENISDRNLLLRTICTSDWAKYPITLLAFLTCFKNEGNWYNDANQDFRRILKSIGYEHYYDVKYIFKDRKISPEDYDMLQSYLLYKLGVEAKGGFVTAAQFEKVIPECLRKYVKRAVAVKHQSIPVTMTLQQVAGLAEI